jgi:hypothetical protein
MNELTPLLSSTEDDLELLLLRSADADEPGSGALPKVATALGVGAAALGLATGAAVAEHAVLGGAAVSKPITLLSVLKWLGVGMTAGALVGGGAHVAFRPAQVGTLARPVPAAPVVAPSPGELREVAPALVPPPPPAQPEEDALAEAEAETAPAGPAAPAAPNVAKAPAVATSPSPASPLGSTASFAPETHAPAKAGEASALSEEVRALDAARRELASGRARAALAAIDAYRSAFPHGSLRTEATVLRVEALLGSGDRAGAEREANAIVRGAPGSRHAARVLDLLAR